MKSEEEIKNRLEKYRDIINLGYSGDTDFSDGCEYGIFVALKWVLSDD